MEIGRKRSRAKSCRRKSWTSAEDSAIANLVLENGTRHWTLIAERLRKVFKIKGRTGKQCRERWHNHLDPDILKTPWGVEEEQLLFEAHQRLGNKWADISKILKGRTDNSIKNHYYSAVRREYRRLKGSEPTRIQLKEAGDIVTSSILKRIEGKGQTKQVACSVDEYFADDLLGEMPCGLEVRGYSINLPYQSSPDYTETECTAEFLWPDCEEDWVDSEVFCLPWY
mmetsp:Transcript_33928/g.59138  ORF Transcript_33928/g.59138 Transcript_33928/m.59138 type:complete len:226 (+) Transcript_33928:22-699(+)|eukprot:CAMPEP_0204906274 /NCGR_PEP_ID=MMETSP1397-20131031/5892_1 /ASSEMBLY_ACC=CAM_ASM_000891 /TAXON_ID=49980 /ORGANISM="Climacostomum Climacostomum virens, Strain Stock W-24" /LENGTH=225 /DNA_ID=CAMNT_0052075261 /DNA_START=22 /DNA_END=699 /DNA_ORIENTATION=+